MFSPSAPPSIIYTTEYIVHSEIQFGSNGQLSCTVQTSPDTSSHVTWWTNGTQLQNSEKYVINSVATGEEDVVQYQLTVKNLQHSDIGSYLCQLNSDFAPEDSQPAWIQVDFRKSKLHTRSPHLSSHCFTNLAWPIFLTVAFFTIFAICTSNHIMT